MDCTLPGSYIHEIFQARVLEWVAIAFSNETITSGKILREYSFETKYQHPIPVNATKEIFSET